MRTSRLIAFELVLLSGLRGHAKLISERIRDQTAIVWFLSPGRVLGFVELSTVNLRLLHST